MLVAAPSNNSSQQSRPPVISGVPAAISIRRLGMELIVTAGDYNQQNRSWTLSGRRAHFATISSPANNQAGSTVIYGHNNRHVFGPLKKLQPGDIAQLRTENGYIFEYAYRYSEKTIPSDTRIFNYAGPPVLTLLTCSGLWNEWRQLSHFDLRSVTPPSARSPEPGAWLTNQTAYRPPWEERAAP